MKNLLTTPSMSEAQFEAQLIEYLSNGVITPPEELQNLKFGSSSDIIIKTALWKYEPDIKTTEQLWQNFKTILEQHNLQALDQPLSHTEFAQVKRQIEMLETPYQAGKFLYGMNGVSEVEVNLDDGRHVYLRVFDQTQVGGGDTVYQVVNQIERPAKVSGKTNARFDVTLLINGLPIIQIELKKKGVDINDALNQMKRYASEQQYTDIFSTLQLLVAMSPNDARYMANTSADTFNKDFAFLWQQRKTSRPVRNWKDFSDQFLSIPMAHNMSTNYMILDGTHNHEALKVMRPYQVYATQSVINKVQQTDFSYGDHRLGYVWHTTGSGKTITSFKTAWLASRLPNIDKVVFVVDRKALTSQTSEKYNAYNPESRETGDHFSKIMDTRNTNELSRVLKSKGNDIIITSIQKLTRLVKRSGFKAPEKNILFVVDEAHRSTNGDSFKEVQKKFKNAAWVGYTGTPMFDEFDDPDDNGNSNENEPFGSGNNNTDGNTKGKASSDSKACTQDVFGECLHSYTIREAIADKNVLGFKVDFKTTIDQEQMKTKYLPEFYKQQHPKWSDKKIQEKIENMTQADMDDEVEPSFYDENEDHVRLVVEDIVDNWEQRSNGRKFNALLTTHINKGKAGRRSSIPMALMYYREFQRVNRELVQRGETPLKVAVTFSYDTSNSDMMLENNNGLLEAMKDYSETFGTQFDARNVDEYFQDVQARLNKSIDDGNYLDLVIVVDQLLTGFDAPDLNTLYVDRTLKGAGLVQAYSRTNRVRDSIDKPWGRIVNYRWPASNEVLMNRALAIYSNKNNANLTEKEQKEANEKDRLTAPDFSKILDEVTGTVESLRNMTDSFAKIPGSETKQKEMIKLLQKFSAGVSELKQFDKDVIFSFSGDDEMDVNTALLNLLHMTAEDHDMLTSVLAKEVRKVVAKIEDIPVSQIDLKMTYLKDILVNYDYLTELLEDLLNQVYLQEFEKVKKTREEIEKFTGTMEDRVYSRDIERAVEAIVAREFPPENSPLHYPYQLHNTAEVTANPELLSLDDVVKGAQQVLMDRVLLDFRNKWGITDIIDSAQIRALIEKHKYGEHDLEDDGKLQEVITEGSRDYKKLSTDPAVSALPKIKYRTRLKNAFYKLADEEKAEE